MQKFIPETLVICKIPPILNNVETKSTKTSTKTKIWTCKKNNSTKTKIWTYGFKSGYQVLKLNTS